MSYTNPNKHVIHVSDRTHQRCKELCARWGISMLDWIEAVVDCAYENDENQPPGEPTPVSKRVLEEFLTEPPPISPEKRKVAWEQPPFWARA